MRRTKFFKDEYYHIFNRGNGKQNIFKDNRDYLRFLFLILHFQSPATFYNLGRQISYFVRHRVFNISTDEIKQIIINRNVNLINFVLMPNHFHFILQENGENGISNYMQRILNAYAKYFNTKYEISGHLFQGPFRSVAIKKNEQLLYLSAYIHRNPREINEWRNKEQNYPWSSYQDCINKNRWGELLKNDIIQQQFNDQNDYKNFIETSGAKTNK